MSYEHRLVEAANGREFYDKIGRDADAQIAALRADLERKDAALKELCKDEPLVEPEWIESDNHGDIRSNASDITRWHLAKIARAALQPKEPPCKA